MPVDYGAVGERRSLAGRAHGFAADLSGLGQFALVSYTVKSSIPLMLPFSSYRCSLGL